MPFLPIAERELRVAARRRSTYRIRFWAVIAGSLLFGWRCLEMLQQQASPAAQGHQLFLTLVILGSCFALFSGAHTTSDCLSAEKREGTMGLLFLTDLKSYDIVIGKLVASSLSAAYGLLAIVPMLAVPLLMGGVTMSEFLRAVIAIGSMLFVSLAAGMVASTYNRNERKAAFYTVLILLLVVCVPFLCAFVLATYFSFQDERDMVKLFSMSPAFMLGSIFEPRFPLVMQFFWASVGMAWGWTLFFLTWVCFRLPGTWQDKTKKIPQERRVAHLARRAKQSRHLRKILDVNPFLWISFRSGHKPSYAWIFLSSMIAIWVLGYFSWNSGMFDLMINGSLVIILNGFFKIWIVTEACQQLIEARRSGALELLLSTPLSDRDIIRGQWLALRRQFAVPLLILTGLELFVIYKGGGNLTGFFSTVVLSLPVDFLALGWAGMWLGLNSKNTTRAISKAVVLIMALPWIVFYLAGLVLEFLFDDFTGVLSAEFMRSLMAVFWAGLSLGAAYLVGFQWGRKNLLRKFRLMATEQYSSKNKEE